MKPLSELTGNKRAIEVLRWICVPVVATLGVLVPRMIVGLLISPAMAQLPGSPVTPSSDFQRLFLPSILAFLTGMAFVVAGSLTAPKRRIATAILLSVLWVGYSFLIHVAVHLGRGTPHIMDFVIAAAGAAGGAAYIRHSVKS